MQLAPYIFYYGRCEEALAFYKSVLGGSYEIQRLGDSPMAGHSPPDSKNDVMHAHFQGPGFSFMASDGRERKPIDPEAGNITLSIEADDDAQGQRLFTALADGGKIKMPFDDAFWGGKFGLLDDRFGVEWMVTAH